MPRGSPLDHPFLNRLNAARVVAIIRTDSAASALEMAGAVARGGIEVVEVTFTTPGAAEAIAEIGTRLPDVLLGAGTVLDLDTLDVACSAGARFVVSPHCDPTLVAAARERGIPCLPGAFTPTEVLTAWRTGATAVKLFPAAHVGPAHLAALRGPFPQIPFVPTGGVDERNVEAWFAAGAIAVGVGGYLVRGAASAIEQSARRLLTAARRGG
ncbi:MAG: bifunctional 4-hydroxy-2-oxoglutarate aldolase/2-dehydro-3-deoxy-phosphogluconate aldolase [Polyangiaceae bacterium]|nr:bifunctional 4-hydroxy-2-oxoglutarate aldolase/2-dehydro-3-deoxy-phosphogluconate aldolase [Polyangiaceae bacterium]